MLVHLVLRSVPEWSLEEHHRVHDDYFRDQGNKNGLKVSRTLESGLSLELAERYRAAGGVETARDLLGHAVENHPGHAGLLYLEKAFDPNQPINWLDVVAHRKFTKNHDKVEGERNL